MEGYLYARMLQDQENNERDAIKRKEAEDIKRESAPRYSWVLLLPPVEHHGRAAHPIKQVMKVRQKRGMKWNGEISAIWKEVITAKLGVSDELETEVEVSQEFTISPGMEARIEQQKIEMVFRGRVLATTYGRLRTTYNKASRR